MSSASWLDRDLTASRYESSWVPKQAKPEDPNRGRLLFIFRLRWQTEGAFAPQ